MSVKLIFLAPVYFNRMKQRHQSFAVELAKLGFDVCFIDPVCAPGYSFVIENKQKNLKVFRVRVPFKATAIAGLQNIAARLALSLVLRHSDFIPQKTFLWVAEPSLAAFTKLCWQAIVYDRCDLHGAFPGQRQNTWRSYEARLFERADLISVSHSYLAENLPENIAAKIVLARNACSGDFLQGLFRADTSLMPQKPGDIVRLVSSGAHYEWSDIDWLAMLADLDGVELHVAGTGRGMAFEKLIKRGNVIFHGHLEHDKLVRVLQNCHIGLIPFKNIELIKGVDPVKAYEYAACGLEVWAPDLPSLLTNEFIGRFIGHKNQAIEALQNFKNGPTVFAGKIPLWSERLQTILDRLHTLRSD